DETTSQSADDESHTGVVISHPGANGGHEFDITATHRMNYKEQKENAPAKKQSEESFKQTVPAQKAKTNQQSGDHRRVSKPIRDATGDHVEPGAEKRYDNRSIEQPDAHSCPLALQAHSREKA